MPIYIAFVGIAILAIGLVGIAVQLGVDHSALAGGAGPWVLIVAAGGVLFCLALLITLIRILRELRWLRSNVTGPPVDIDEILTSTGPILQLTLRASKRWWLRIDQPTAAPGKQKRHAHIYRKDETTIVVNEDGTGSHGTESGTRIPEWAAELLRSKRFSITEDNRVRPGLVTPFIFVDPLEELLMNALINAYPKFDRLITIVEADESPAIDIRDLKRG